jgi:hypothetical protein
LTFDPFDGIIFSSTDERQQIMACSAQKLCDKLTAEFGIWAKIVDGYPTIGEDCVHTGEYEGYAVVDYYDGYASPMYEFSIFKPILDYAASQGWRGELYDPGTAKFYKD